MKKHLLLSFILLVVYSISFSQTTKTKGFKDYFTEGNFLVLEKNYNRALTNFKEAYKLDSSSANINYMLGLCYINTETEKNKALSFLEKAVKDTKKNYIDLESSEKSAPVNAFYYYGVALHLNYRFDEAIANYEKFKSYLKDTQSDLMLDVNRKIEISKNAKEFVAAPTNVALKNLGDSINSPYPDYGPVISADESMLIFTSRRPGGMTDEKDDYDQYYEDIYIAYKKKDSTWTKPVSISPNINTPEHEASVGLVADGQTLLIYKGSNGGDIFTCTLEDNGWSYPIPLGSDINTSNWETSACITPDGNTIYFVSNRPGGLGGRDIWKCQKLPNGKWGKAMNVGAPINTPYDEESPFIHPKQNLLFFSSTGHKTIGGFDIFFSYLENDKWGEPQNIGYPINTTDDDLFYFSSLDGKRGYYASASRPDGRGEKDIYEMYIPDLKEQNLLLVKGLIVPANGEIMPQNLEILVTNAAGDLVGTYKPSKRNGGFVIILPDNENYTVSYQQDGKEFFSEKMEVPPNVGYRELSREIRLRPGGNGILEQKDSAVVNQDMSKFISVDGKLFDEKGEPYKNMNVNLLNSQGKIVKSTKTNEFGFFSFSPLAQNEDYLIALDESNTSNIGNKSYAEFKDNKGKLLKTQKLGKKYQMASSKTSVAFKTNSNSLVNSTNVKDDKSDKVSNVKITSPEQLAKVDNRKFEMYFKYNIFETDVNDAPFKEFIENVMAVYNKNGKIDFSVYASASTVPTKKFSSNKELAKSRADKAKEQLTKALKEKGVDASKVNFIKTTTRVGGPQYNSDYITNKSTYEKYQFVKITAK